MVLKTIFPGCGARADMLILGRDIGLGGVDVQCHDVTLI